MNIIAKTTLVITTPTAKDNPFYGNTISRKTITDEYILNKFDGVTCPNNGVEVGFKYGNSTFILKANRYAFADHDNGNYEVLISNNDYLFELDIHTDENGNINFDDDTFTINIYDAMETDGDMIDCVDADYIKPLE